MRDKIYMEDITEEVVEIILTTCKNEDVSLFVGAGISLENPANLPSSMGLKLDILKLLASLPPKFFDVEEDKALIQEYLSSTMLEHMIQDITEALGNPALDIFNVFKYGKPNLYHLLIAKFAHLGLIKRIFTTNFDTLIERAFDAEGIKYNVFETEHDFAEYIISPENYTDFPIFKLHGTIAFSEKGEICEHRVVEAISELKFQTRLMKKHLEKNNINVVSIGFERLVTPEDTLITSLDHLGLKLPEWVSQVLTKSLETSTFIIIGWNGFDLDISPLFLKSGKKILWMIHRTSDMNKTKKKLSNTEAEIESIRQILQSKGWSPNMIRFALLSIGNLLLDELPSADREREEIIAVSGGNYFVVFTPQLIGRLWDQLSTQIGTIPILPDTTEEVKKQIDTYLYNWSKSVPSVLGHWAIGKFFLHHGEYKNTQALLTNLLESIQEQGYHDIESLMYLDLGDVNALYGNKEEANRCFLSAIQLFQEKIQGRTNELSGRFRLRQLAEIPERAYFGMGVLACEFFHFKDAEEAFKNMSIEKSIISALVHFCREEFRESIKLLSEIQFRFKASTKFHYYLYYYLRLLYADIYWQFREYDNACKLYSIVLDASTKLGWPRHQVHALDGLAKTYSAPGIQCDLWKAAKYAAQAIEVAKMAEYRVGKASASYFFGRIYATIGMKDIAKNSFRSSEKYFKSMGHEFGINQCREAMGGITGRYDTFATDSCIPQRIWTDYGSDFRVGRLTRVPVGLKNHPCSKCGKPTLSGAIICTSDGRPVIESADDDDPNILCLNCGYWFD